MKLTLKGICVVALLCPIQPLRLVQAQTVATTAAKGAGPFAYDSAKEVMLTGTVSKVLTHASPGMVPGSHLLLTTLSGSVDVSLGTFALRGQGALSVEPGQSVQITGVAKTIRDSRVFLARTVTVGSHPYAIRNEHGIFVSPQTRVRGSEKNTQKNSTGNSL